VPVEDRALAAGGVVLRQPRDAVEQIGAAFVVEVLRRELALARRASEPLAHVACERVRARYVRLDRDVALGEWRHASRTQRKPEKICRRSGKSQLRIVLRTTRKRV